MLLWYLCTHAHAQSLVVPRLISEKQFTNALNFSTFLEYWIILCLVCVLVWHVDKGYVYLYLCTHDGCVVLYASQELDANWVVQNWVVL